MKFHYDKAHLQDYFILAARVLMAFILFSYGWGKLTGGQFGVTEETLRLPLREVDLFRLSWYLADHEPFKSFVGVSQLIAGGLLLYNRTVILGAFMVIPIWANILVWDMTFMGLYTPFTIRLSFYLLLTFLILWHHRNVVLPMVQNFVSSGGAPKFKYPVWAYLILPLPAFCLELIGGLPAAAVHLFRHLFK